MIDIKKVLIKSVQIPDDEVAILLSSGVDSSSVLFALLEAKKKVTAYTFCLDDRVSKDLKYAEITANEFNVPFVKIILPTNIDLLKEDLIDLIRYGAKTKTDFECGWPMLYAYKLIKEKNIFSGFGADGHFCISKKGMIHFKNKINEFRNNLWNKESYVQKHMHKNLSKVYNKNFIAPYLSQDMYKLFNGTTWEQVNRPHQKQPIRDSFPQEFARIKIFQHQNLQKGDSGISEHFEKLLDTELNIKKHKSVVGIYNYLVKNLSENKNEIMDV